MLRPRFRLGKRIATDRQWAAGLAQPRLALPDGLDRNIVKRCQQACPDRSSGKKRAAWGSPNWGRPHDRI